MKHLDLFSGIGGFALAARWMGWETVQFVEIDPFCQKVLKKHWPKVPIHDDIKTYSGGTADILTGGFPCQPFSTASHGNRVTEDLWPEMVKVIRDTAPRLVVAENVPGYSFEHIDRACDDLLRLNYKLEIFEVDFQFRHHTRRRIYIAAYAYSDCQSRRVEYEEAQNLCETAGQWRYQCEPMGMDDGISGELDRRKRLRGLGNAIVPQVAYTIFQAMTH